MDNFVVSARKYRPSTFMSVVGQQALVTTLKNAVSKNHLAHAYLFCGPRGVGKTTCARIFAKTINCQQLTSDFEACNECESCVSFNESRSYNIHELDAASNNSVDDIRSLIEQVRIPPQLGKYSVYIIDEVHMLSAAAFNAFLKTLEEPPAHALFVLATTEKHKIIPTILSRCQIYDFNRIGIADTVAHLQYVASKEGVEAEPEALNVIAQKSDGGMRDALSIFDQVVSFSGNEISYQHVIDNLNVLDYNYYFRLVEAFLQNDVPQAMIIFNEILSKGFDGSHFVSGLSAHLRDVMVCKDAQTVQLLEVGASIGESYKKQAVACDLDFLYNALTISNQCDLDYRLSKNKRLLVEIMLIRLCQLSDKKKNKLTEDKAKQLAPIFTSATAPEQKSQITPPTEKIPVPPPVLPTQAVSEPLVATKRTPQVELPSFSISAGLRKKEVKAEETKKELSRKENFTENDLKVAWKTFARSVSSQVHLFNTMCNNFPTLKSENLFEVVVENSFQQEKLNEAKADIMQVIGNSLRNDFIEMKVIISEVDISTAKLPKDRFDELVEKSSPFKKMVLELGLEIT